MLFYVGTLTREGGEGILTCRLTEAGIEKTGCYTATKDPNYLIWSALNRCLYATGSDAEEEYRGTVSAFIPEGDALRPVSCQKTGGNGPCFLAESDDGRYLYTANYGSGSVCVMPARPALGERTQLAEHTGYGPHPSRQNGPHPHQVIFMPGTDRLLAVDLGTDEVWIYRADRESGLLSHLKSLHLHGGPRHIAFGPNGFAYLAHELSSEVTVLRLKGDEIVPVQTLSTLPQGADMPNTAAAIRVSLDGKKLYVSNRGHGSVAVFDIREDGSLSPLRHIPAGIYPRDFQLLPDGGILAADQRAGVRWIDENGREKAFLPEIGAVCICIPEDEK